MNGKIIRYDPVKMYGFVHGQDGIDRLMTVRDIEAMGFEFTIPVGTDIQFEPGTDTLGRQILISPKKI